MTRLRPLIGPATLLVVASLAAMPARAQSVLVAPTVVFMNHDTRAGSIELVNTGNESAEVSVSTVFGYPVSDSAGRISVMMTERPDSTQPSAASWIVAYPTHIVIRPGAHQIIRLLSKATSALPDGEYWTRLVISAKGGAVRLSEVRAADTAAIRVGVSLEVRTVIALLYRKGAVRTGLSIGTPATRVVGDSLEVRVPLKREGNAAFLGMLRLSLVDAAGREMAREAHQTAVYYDLTPAWRLPIDRSRRGPYTLRVTLDNVRDDVPMGVRLPFVPQDKIVPLSP
jgi:P pilus assembly chaperone PapD